MNAPRVTRRIHQRPRRDKQVDLHGFILRGKELGDISEYEKTNLYFSIYVDELVLIIVWYLIPQGWLFLNSRP